MNFIVKICKNAKDLKLNTQKRTDSLITAKSQCSTLEEMVGWECTFESSQILESTGNVLFQSLLMKMKSKS